MCTVNNSNEITLTAPPDYNGVESITIEVFDSFGNSDSQGNIVITVNAVNDAPELSDMELETDEEVSLVIELAGFDLDGDTPLFYSILTNVDNGLILSGTDTLSVFPTELIEGGIISYRPNNYFTGSNNFTYLVNDGEYNSVLNGTVQIEVINVNDPPVTQNVSISVLEGQSTTDVFDVSDPDGDDIDQCTIEAQPLEGEVEVEGISFTYSAPGNDTGDPGDSFTYSCSAGNEDSNISAVTIAILPSNDAPILDNINYT